MGSSRTVSHSDVHHFIAKLISGEWYEAFKNEKGRVPRIQIVVDPGINAFELKKELENSDKVSLVSSDQARPDFRLIIHRNEQAELEQISTNNKVWRDIAKNAVVGPPLPPYIWKGFFFGPQVGYSTNVSSGGTGTISSNGGGSAIGGRLGWIVTGREGTWAWIPQLTINVDQGVSSSVTINTSSNPLSGTIGMVDYMIDPLKFGWSFAGKRAFIYVPIGGGLLQMTDGASGTTGYEGHIGLGLEYRLSKYLTPYVEVIGEYGGASSLTSGNVTYPQSISLLNIRAMIGVDWFPWVNRGDYLADGE